MTCSGCQLQFCFLHGTMHRHLTCEEFQRTPRGREIQETELTLLRYTKPCSHCGTAIQKSYGCGYVVCCSCHNGMCYVCGTHLYLGGSEERPHCLRCNRGYVDHRYDTIRRIRLFLSLPFVIPVLILFCLHSTLYDMLVLSACETMIQCADNTGTKPCAQRAAQRMVCGILLLVLLVSILALSLSYFVTFLVLYSLGWLFRLEFVMDFAVKGIYGNEEPPRCFRRTEDEDQPRPPVDHFQVPPPPLDPPQIRASPFRVAIFGRLQAFFVILDEFGIPASQRMLDIPAGYANDPYQIEIPTLAVATEVDSNV